MSKSAGAPALLPNGAFLAEPHLQRLLAALNPQGLGTTRVVGGAVRNAILGEPVHEVDCASLLTPPELRERASAAGLRVIPTGERFGTLTIMVGDRPFEVTTLRQDVATDGRFADVAFGTDWNEDAARRDFTMNALYCDADGTLHDPVGGYDDILARRVRFIGDADQRVAEDYLRVLRFFRFFASHGAGEIDGAGFRACVRARAHMRRLSGERLRQEILKLVAARRAQTSLGYLAQTGILIDLIGVPLLGRFERLAAIGTARNVSPSPILLLAALAVRAAEDASRLFTKLRLSRAEAKLLDLVGRWAKRLSAPESRRQRVGQEALGSHYGEIALVAWAESGADAKAAAWRAVLDQAEADPVPPFPLRGADILSLGLGEHEQIGVLLARARQAWSDSDFRLRRDDLIALLRGQ